MLDFGSWGTAYQSAKDEVIGKVKIAVEQLKSQTAYTWKVVEMKAPDGYELNPESWEQTFNLNTHAVEVQFSNTAPGSLKLQKISENAELVKDKCLLYAGRRRIWNLCVTGRCPGRSESDRHTENRCRWKY